jgi:hypothetical protein
MNTILLPGPDGPSAQVSTKAGELHTSSVAHREENVAGATVGLTDAQFEALGKAS